MNFFHFFHKHKWEQHNNVKIYFQKGKREKIEMQLDFVKICHRCNTMKYIFNDKMHKTRIKNDKEKIK
jgi:hypothetical protein